MHWSLLAKDSRAISCEFLSLGAIRHLLYAMDNREHTDSQIQGSLAMEVQISFLVLYKIFLLLLYAKIPRVENYSVHS